jgi:hypothetical protein
MGRHADVPGKEKRSACPGSAPFLAGVRPPSDVFWRRGLKPSQNTEKDELKPVESHVKKKKTLSYGEPLKCSISFFVRSL